MSLRVVGCTHEHSTVAVRERLAFNPGQTREALTRWREDFPQTEAVLLSTCNRVEFYAATKSPSANLTHNDVAGFLAGFHQLPLDEVNGHLFDQSGEDAVRHLFTVASSLDSMVLGEPQILSQVKQAYQVAQEIDSIGPYTHSAFQAAEHVAKRVANETTIHRRRTSIPSVAVADFAGQIFERFDDKEVLVIGAGEMAEETLRYLQDRGARKITVVNRSTEAAAQLAEQFQGKAANWDTLHDALIAADLVISTTAAPEPIVTLESYRDHIEPPRYQRPLFILDLAIPRDFEPAIGDSLGVYLYSIDDLTAACQKNSRKREKELPSAIRIVEEETRRFMTGMRYRAMSPTIAQLREVWQEPKQQELERLFNKLPDLDEQGQTEVTQFAERLINKLLHPPMESLRDEAQNGPTQGLLDALRRLFRLSDD